MIKVLKCCMPQHICSAIQFTDDSPETLIEINKIVDPLVVNYSQSKPTLKIPNLGGEDLTCNIGDYLVFSGYEISVFINETFKTAFTEVII